MAIATDAASSTLADKVRTQGIIILFRKDGSLRAVTWTDFGWVYDPTPTNDVTTTTLTGNRDGVNVTVKEAITEVAKSWSFGTVSLTDSIRALHIGSDIETSDVSGMTGVKGGTESVGSTTGEMIVIRKVSGGPHLVIYYPSVQLRGDGEGEQESFTRLNFVSTVIADSTFEPPATIIDTYDATSFEYGVWYIVPDALLDDVLDALNDIQPAA
ncbi:hypothetical protein [Deinococcus cellulosilyticus]|uniref:Uncharacterized protein n=1 Tax=Deinococcus cellulosilyticus (strain DSM 18568 / NBRC 106333 / KACC 11606 / 5516J-15) TaxID=1223518 RepID=A0A511N074_DEIC1|nr:hypothetical protein [Deinococcus cellulosilyticus]GEM45911.1 hypothetical protein DC3_15460 [Deinococcus cellulosilyticus NBRC 106333 = KACC 11606]